jgi:putative chitobiose transport system substrate-binding protein
VIEGVEPNAGSLWTFWLSPTFDDYINSTIARFEETYPGVKVNWEDHQATFLEDYRNAMAAGTAPDVANLSDTEGWVREFASKGLLLSMTDNLPQNVIDQYFPGLFNLQTVDGKSYQVPWYQAIAVELDQQADLCRASGLEGRRFPRLSMISLPYARPLRKRRGPFATCVSPIQTSCGTWLTRAA